MVKMLRIVGLRGSAAIPGPEPRPEPDPYPAPTPDPEPLPTPDPDPTPPLQGPLPEPGPVTTTHSGTAIARRANTLTPPLNGAKITRILTQPDRGTVRANYDSTLTYMLVDDASGRNSSGSTNFTFEVSRNDAFETHQMNVEIDTFSSDIHVEGWMLQPLLSHAIDDNGDIEVYPGPGHKDWYFTAGSHGYSRDKITAEIRQTATDEWLTNQDPIVYGSQAKPLLFSDFEGFIRSKVFGPSNRSVGGHLERGYTYKPTDRSGLTTTLAA